MYMRSFNEKENASKAEDKVENDVKFVSYIDTSEEIEGKWEWNSNITFTLFPFQNKSKLLHSGKGKRTKN